MESAGKDDARQALLNESKQALTLLSALTARLEAFTDQLEQEIRRQDTDQEAGDDPR